MTIKQFQELYFISQIDVDDFDKSVRMVGCISSKTPEQVDRMPMKRFNRLCEKIGLQFERLSRNLLDSKPKSHVFVNGRIYRIHYDITHVNAGKYIEAITFGKDVVENLHKIMATICTPVNWRLKPYERDHKMIARDMESMNFEAAYHAAVFFYTHFNVSMQLIQPYLIKELAKKGVNKEAAEALLQTSISILDGFTQPRWSLNLKAYLLNRFTT